MEVRDITLLPAELGIPASGSAITASLGATAALLNKLHSFIACKPNDAVKHLKEDIDEITASLIKLSEAENPSPTAKRWMEQARELSYDIHDYFDNIICSRADADAKRISQFKARSEASIERRDRYKLIDLLTFRRRLPDLHVDMIDDRRMNEFAMKLHDTDNEKKLKVVPIFGPEGVGKTELAKRIYHKIGVRFPCRAFLRVSEIPDVRRILTSMFTQIKGDQPSCRWDAHKLTEEIKENLRNKRYFIVVDDLWTQPVWDVIRRAFPDGDGRSRVITTTQVEDVALACCNYESDNVFKMIPLNIVLQSQKLYFHGVFGFEGDCSTVFKKVLQGIIRKCGELPSTSINITSLFEQWKEEMEEVVNHMYNNLPPHLQTCLLYLNMYPANYVLWKDDLVKQWLTEDFLSKVDMQDRAEIVGGYFDELVRRGMIQPVDKKYNKVLSCTAHRMIRTIIACKSKEQNFITTVNYSHSNVTLMEKVRRLSVQFGGTRRASVPACIRTADVRSLGFFGFYDCLPKIENFSVLRLLVLHIWANQNWTNQGMISVDLTRIGELSVLRYLKIACNITVELPSKIEGLKCLETLEIDASEAKLPHDIGGINSLRTLGYVDLCSNSINNVMDLQKLVNLRDLHLTCSRLEHDDLEGKLKCLGPILEKLGNLESLTFEPTGSSSVNPLGSTGASNMSISCDVLSSITPASAHLHRLELSRRYCIFSHLPEWTKELCNLCVLKIAVGELAPRDIVVLGGLSDLVSLSLYVRIELADKIIFDNKGFRVLTYFKFICDAPNMSFRVGAMPNVQRIVLGISPNRINHYDPSAIGIRHLSGLKEITVKVGGGSTDKTSRNAAAALVTAFAKHPSYPHVRIQWVDWIFHEDSNNKTIRAKSGTSVASETSSPVQTAELSKAVSEKKVSMEVASCSPVSFKRRDDSNPEITSEEGAIVVPTTLAQVSSYIPKDTPKNRLRYESKGDPMIGLVKSVLERALIQAKSGIVEEAKLHQRAESDLLFIIGEFENMMSLLNVMDDERVVKDIVVNTWVMRIQELAYYVEDRLELIGNVDRKSHRWHLLLTSCTARRTLSVDDKGAEIEQLKGRVEYVSRTKPVNVQAQLQTASSGPVVGSSTAVNMTLEGRDATTTQQRLQGDLTQLITKKDGDLHVISLWGKFGDFGVTSIIRKSYSDPEVCHNFKCRAWVKLMHPFNPQEFIRCLLTQFYANATTCEEQHVIGVEILTWMEAPQGDILQEFVRHVNERRYLIVLEDLSTMPEWDAIRTFLPDRKNGSAIIVSSQHFEVASLCVGQPHKVLELMRLPNKQAVYAFLKGEYEVSRSGGHLASSRWNIDDISSYEKILLPEKDAAIAWMNNSPIVGREAQMDELRRYTSKAGLDSSKVISVWGIAGVGKSALVRNLYFNEMLEGSVFEKFSWVDVSHPFNLRDFCRSLLMGFHSERDPIKECHELMKQYRCLIVIDDLHTKEEWDLIQSSLVSRSSKSLIIVITAEANTATYCIENQDLAFNLKGLQDRAAFDLFKKEVSGKNPRPYSLFEPEMEELRKLTLKCGGLPKVIVAIADFLSTKTGTLMETANSVSENFMKCLETNPELDGLGELFNWLHSYLHTCPNFLKPCIFYMLIFRQNKIIRRRRLVRRWIAEGYSRDRPGRSAEEDGENLFSRLLDLSIIQQVPQLVSLVSNDKRMVFCLINDFICEYIFSRQIDKNFVLELGGSCSLTTQRTGRHLIILEDWERDRIVFNNIDFSMLRSFTVCGKWQSFFISRNMKLLRVLDLEDASGVTDGDLDEMLPHLRSLKFLSIRGCREVSHLPVSLGDLMQLQSLDVRHTSIFSLPANITMLRKLQYIRSGITDTAEDLITPLLSKSSMFSRNRSPVGVKVPKGIGKLTMLHTLGVVNVHNSGMKAIQGLKKLTQLHKLGVSGINRRNSKKFFSAISGHVHLESLSVHLDQGNQGCLDVQDSLVELWASKNLHSLKLYGLFDKLPKWCDRLTNLRKLNLKIVTLTKEDIEIIGNLPYLAILRLHLMQPKNHRLDFSIPEYEDKRSCYQRVKILVITCSYNLCVTFGSKLENLELLEVHYGSGQSNQLSGLNYLSELKEVFLRTSDENLQKDVLGQLVKHTKNPILKRGLAYNVYPDGY